jgi:hypothetical protein
MPKRTLAVVFAIPLAVASFSVASAAAADETAAKPGTITLKPTTVVGRYKRPSVVIEVTRARAEVKLADLADPAVEKIIRAASNAPF